MSNVPLRFLAAVNEQVLSEDTRPDFAFKYIDISQVDGNGNVTIPRDQTTFGIAPSRARRLAEPGSTVVSTVRTYLRAIGTVPSAEDPLVFSTGFAVLRPTQGDSRYFSYACRSDAFVNQVVARSVGVSYPAISPSDLMDIRLPSPDAEEQRRIADFLDDRVARIDQIITARRQQSSALDSLHFASMSGAVDELGARYGWAPLRRFSVGIEQGGSPTAEDRLAEPHEVGVLKTSAIQRGRFLASKHKAIGPESLDPSHQVRDGDLLVTRGSGSAELVGDSAVAQLTGTPLYLSDLTYRVRGLGVDAHFACFALLSARSRAELRALVRQGSGPAKARGEDILSLPIPAAPDDDQRELVTVVQDAGRQHDSAQQLLAESIRLMIEYKQALIIAAVTGEVDVATTGSGIPG